MYCQYCGKEIPDDSKVCQYCETRLKDDDSPSAKRRRGAGRTILLVIVLLAVAGFVGIGIKSFLDSRPPDLSKPENLTAVWGGNTKPMSLTGLNDAEKYAYINSLALRQTHMIDVNLTLNSEGLGDAVLTMTTNHKGDLTEDDLAGMSEMDREMAEYFAESVTTADYKVSARYENQTLYLTGTILDPYGDLPGDFVLEMTLPFTITEDRARFKGEGTLTSVDGQYQYQLEVSFGEFLKNMK